MVSVDPTQAIYNPMLQKVVQGVGGIEMRINEIKKREDRKWKQKASDNMTVKQ